MNGQFDLGAMVPSRYFFVIASVLGVLFASIAPTDGQSVMLVIVQWQLQTLLPMGLILFCHLLLARWRPFAELGSLWRLLISGLLGAICFSPLALGLDVVLANQSIASGWWQAWMEELGHLGPPVVITWLAINAPFLLGWRLQAPVTTAPSDKAKSLPDYPFMALLPAERRAPPMWLKAELHYLQVVTSKGKALILYNLVDAIRELGEAGFQPHRSYWVACDAVASFEKRGRQGMLHLHNGDSVPVSRSNLTKIAKRFG